MTPLEAARYRAHIRWREYREAWRRKGFVGDIRNDPGNGVAVRFRKAVAELVALEKKDAARSVAVSDGTP